MLAIRCIPIFELSKSLNSKIDDLIELQERLEAQIDDSDVILSSEFSDQIKEIEAKIEICQEILFEIQLD